jgi:hypothetical protein
MILDIKDYVSEDALLLEPRERYDSCIIGATYDGEKIIYDAVKIIEALIEEDEMTEDDATEYFEFNILGAYLGENTPIYVGTMML